MKSYQSAPFLVRKAVVERDGHRCWYCGKELDPLLTHPSVKGAASVDHVLPVSRGGSNNPGNLVACCFQCNAAKHDMTLEEFRVAVQLRRAPTHKARLLLGRALADLRLSCGPTPVDEDIERAIAWCEAQAQPHIFFGETREKE